MTTEKPYRESWAELTPEEVEQRKTIQRLNDTLRTKMNANPGNNRVVIMGALSQSDVELQMLVLAAVRAFYLFTEDNDPHGEHDFGSVVVKGETYFFKIDYYDLNLENGSEEPWNPAVTRRVLTVFHSDDY